jgi:hypothetical protein
MPTVTANRLFQPREQDKTTHPCSSGYRPRRNNIVTLRLRNSLQPERFSLIEQSITKAYSLSCNVIYPRDGSRIRLKIIYDPFEMEYSFQSLVTVGCCNKPGG